MLQENIPTESTESLPGNGHAHTRLLSSNSTLLWKMVIPVFFGVILAGFMLTFLLTPTEDIYLSMMPVWAARVLAIVLFGVWVAFVARRLWRLKRVEANETHLYASDYWTTVRYPWTDVAGWSESRLLGKRIVIMHLHAPGRFGKQLPFLPSSLYKEWKAEQEAPSASSESPSDTANLS
ncbi:MAG: hypothetical protein J0L99_18410 [Chitinophagales bacterium]|nr:hypothetical protein [Chitinophagales bacterium]